MRCLVTGGAGFIGSNLVEALLRRGDDVAVFDNFSTGRRENLADAESWRAEGGGTFEVFEADVRDRAAVERAMKGVDVVFHQAALPSVARSVEDPLSSHEVNVTGILHLLLAARDQGVRRFVSASSSSLYGESPTLPKVETMERAPISPYGLDKLAGETYCALFTKLYGLQTVALRYFNVFGPRQDPNSEYAAVIPKFVTLMQEGQPATVNGDGSQTRDFTYIDNVVDANLKAAEAPPEACGEAYNVACGERISLLELVDAIGRVLGRKIDPVFGPPRPGDIQHSLADIDKARRLIGYEPKVGLDEGLNRVIDWYGSR
jgi:nucleoside-diphosphate-sugar epimerase